MTVPEVDERTEHKRVNIPDTEKWELKQLMAAGAIPKSDLPDFDEETGLLPNQDDDSGIVLILFIAHKIVFKICKC